MYKRNSMVNWLTHIFHLLSHFSTTHFLVEKKNIERILRGITCKCLSHLSLVWKLYSMYHDFLYQFHFKEVDSHWNWCGSMILSLSLPLIFILCRYHPTLSWFLNHHWISFLPLNKTSFILSHVRKHCFS